MKYYLRLAGVLLLLSASAGLANVQEDSAIVTGTIVNGSRNNLPVAGVDVVLHLMGDQSGREIVGPRPHVISDTLGRFAFRNVKLEPGTAFYPQVTFQSVPYAGDIASITAGSAMPVQKITVFDTTRSDSAIVNTMNHVIIEAGKGVLQIREIFQLQNRGRFTYIGEKIQSRSADTGLIFTLPERATALQTGGDLMKCCAVIEGRQVFDTMAFKPGDRRVVLNYQLPLKSQDFTLTRGIAFPTGMLDIYVSQPASIAKIQIQAMSPAENQELAVTGDNFEIRDQTYTRYAIGDVGRGSSIGIQLAALPGPPGNMTLITILFLSVFSLIIVGSLMAKKRSKQAIVALNNGNLPTTTPCLKEMRQTKIELILKLDIEFEKGRIREDAYKKRRDELVHQILVLDTQV